MANFAIKNLNGWNNVEGKIFLGEELGLTGAEASVQRLAAGENPAFLHSHKTHEELYIIISDICSRVLLNARGMFITLT